MSKGYFRGNRICNKVYSLFDLALKLDKPIHPDVTWTVSLLNGRGYFNDLQIQSLALAASIIINEPIVPKIKIVWDSPIDGTTMSRNPKLKLGLYPMFLLRGFKRDLTNDDVEKEVFGANCKGSPNFRFDNKYASLIRSWLSVNPQQWSLSLGYRAKYLGMNYVTTKYAITGDADTICRRPCVKYFMDEVNKSPNSFVWTPWFDKTFVTVGLCIYNMEKYRNVFFPILCNESWNIPKGDSRYIPIILERYPELEKVLDIKTYDINFHAEKFHVCKKRGNIWDDEKTFNYHAWKGDIRANPTEFFKNYNQILDSLFVSGRKQLEEQNKK